jgi:hypothetical protein
MSPSDAFWAAYGLPIASVVAAIVVTSYLWLMSRAFDRRYGRDHTPAE